MHQAADCPCVMISLGAGLSGHRSASCLVHVYGEGPSVLWSQITSSDSNDFILEALTPPDAIVYESGAFGGVCGARGGA